MRTRTPNRVIVPLTPGGRENRVVTAAAAGPESRKRAIRCRATASSSANAAPTISSGTSVVNP
jgi:hypothetical protein